MSLSAYRFHDAIDRLYDVTWNAFCSRYVEMIKPRLRDDAHPGSRSAAAHTAVTSLDVLLRLLHPFMPFITEECAQRLPHAAPSLQFREWPRAEPRWRDEITALHRGAVDELLQLVYRVRALRDENDVPEGVRHRLQVRGGDPSIDVADRVRLLPVLVAVDAEAAAELSGGLSVVAGTLEGRYHLVVSERERARTERRISELVTTVHRLEAQLANDAFTSRARPEVVEQARRRLDEARRQHAALLDQLERV